MHDNEYEDHITAEHFDFTQAKIGKPIITSTQIIVPVENFGILKGVFDIKVATFFLSATLVYDDVIKSERVYRLYAHETGKVVWGKRETIIDGTFEPSDKPMFSHGIYAVSKEPFAWLGWVIVAASVRVEDRVPFR